LNELNIDIPVFNQIRAIQRKSVQSENFLITRMLISGLLSSNSGKVLPNGTEKKESLIYSWAIISP
jgi:hypothetical protein